MKKLEELIVAICLADIAYIAGFIIGQRDGMAKHAIEEARICTANVDFRTYNLTPHAREHKKARLY